jgi:AcrR family transcriptional regulator
MGQVNDSVTRPRGTRGELRREQILTAAAALFARRGFHGVTIDDIGSAVGMTGPGLYRHFPGKEAVLAQMLLAISERLLAEGSRRVVAAPDPERALDALLDWHISFALSQPDLITVQNRELANVPEPAQRQVRRLQRLYVEEWVTVASELSPHASAAVLRSALHAMFGLLNSTPHIISQHGPGELPADAMASLLHTMARAALTAAALLAGTVVLCGLRNHQHRGQAGGRRQRACLRGDREGLDRERGETP